MDSLKFDKKVEQLLLQNNN